MPIGIRLKLQIHPNVRAGSESGAADCTGPGFA